MHSLLHINKKFFLVITICAFFVLDAVASIKLPAIFSNHMVLQQKSKVALWGCTDAGEEITIYESWSGRSIKTKADALGNWKVQLQTLSASGPYTLTLDGANKIELKDVFLGEVWLCSGLPAFPFSEIIKHKNDTK